MLRVDRSQKTLTAMTETALVGSGGTERNLQELICCNQEAFFNEMGEELLLIGEELQPSDMVKNRIDLLAIDKQGAVVVIELKRGKDRYQLLQALGYAAMVADWDQDQLLDALAQQDDGSPDDAEEAVQDFLDVDVTQLNEQQRIILLAEAYDLEVLAAAEWLREQYGVEIRCYQVQLATDEAGEYMSCTCILPAPELRDHVGPRPTPRPRDPQKVLDSIRNEAVRGFLEAELAAGREHSSSGRQVIYRINGKRRIWVTARKDRAYVWQRGRFEDDIDVWKQKLRPDLTIGTVEQGRSLRFYLTTEEDFRRFKEFVENELPTAGLLEAAGPAGDDE